MKSLTEAEYNELIAAKAERDRLHALVNNAEIEDFIKGTQLEAAHQVERWGEANDRAKRPADWFWLVGYLAGKALHAAVSGNTEKAKHHCISTAAALFNWHRAISGTSNSMSPGSSDVAKIVEESFPGETAVANKELGERILHMLKAEEQTAMSVETIMHTLNSNYSAKYTAVQVLMELERMEKDTMVWSRLSAAGTVWESVPF